MERSRRGVQAEKDVGAKAWRWECGVGVKAAGGGRPMGMARTV